MIFSTIFVLCTVLAGAFFFNHTKNEIVCEYVKPVVLIGYQMLTDFGKFKDVLLVDGGVISQIKPAVEPIINQFAPHLMVVLEKLVKEVIEIVNANPMLVMVIGAFLLRKKGDILTKVLIVPIVLLAGIVKADLALIAENIPLVEVVAISSSFFLLCIFVFNGFSKLGHYVMFPLLLIEMTSVMVTLFRVLHIEIFILFVIVFGVCLAYCYFWNKGSDIVAAVIIYYGFAHAFNVRSGMVMIAIFLLTGLFA